MIDARYRISLLKPAEAEIEFRRLVNLCLDARRRETAAVNGADTKSRCEVGNQPTFVYDSYSTATGYQLPVPEYRKHDDVMGVTGSDITDTDTTTAPGYHGMSEHQMDTNKTCRMHEISLTASQVLYQTYIGPVTT